MGPKRMIGMFFRSVNAAGTAYLVGKVGIKLYHELRKMQKEKLRADELRRRFTEEYRTIHGDEPSEELINTVLKSYDAVERPFRKRINEICAAAKKMVL